MKVVFTDHAKRRARDRHLSLKVVKSFIENPDDAEQSQKDSRRFLIKKAYFSHAFKKQHLLMAICEKEGDVLVVITLIDTSKVKKYS